MSQRSKNLLEAFNQSKAPEKSTEPVAQPKGSAPKVGGPFADAAPVARARTPVEAPRAQSSAPASAQPRWRVVALCAGVAVIFFFVGRASVGAVQAGTPSGEASVAPGTPPVAPASAPRPSAAQSRQDALRDKANQSTILAITYKRSDANKALSLETEARLLELGLPAAAYQYPGREEIYVLVGAAPKGSDLDALLAKVKAATSKRGQKDFASARTVSIDKFVQR